MDNDGTGMIAAKTLEQLRALLAAQRAKEKDVIRRASSSQS